MLVSLIFRQTTPQWLLVDQSESLETQTPENRLLKTKGKKKITRVTLKQSSLLNSFNALIRFFKGAQAAIFFKSSSVKSAKKKVVSQEEQTPKKNQ